MSDIGNISPENFGKFVNILTFVTGFGQAWTCAAICRATDFRYSFLGTYRFPPRKVRVNADICDPTSIGRGLYRMIEIFCTDTAPGCVTI